MSNAVQPVNKQTPSLETLPLQLQNEIEKTLRALRSTSLETPESPDSLPPCTDSVHSGPQLPPPQVGVYALYYLLTKENMRLETNSTEHSRAEMHQNQKESDALYKERLAEITKAHKDEKSVKRWSVASQTFHWLLAFTGLIVGVGLICTGAAVIAGSLMLAGGLLAVTNQIMQSTGAWQKIAEKMVGDSPEAKRAAILWIQIGVSIIALLLSGVGGYYSGLSTLGGALSAMAAMHMSGMQLGVAISNLGTGLTQSRHKTRMARIKEIEKRRTYFENKREDIKERFERSLEQWEDLQEALLHALEQERLLAQLFHSGIAR